METTADSTQVVNGVSNTPENGDTSHTPGVRFAKPDLSEPNDMMPSEAEFSNNIDQLEPPQFLIRAFNAVGVQQREIQLKKYAPVYVGRALGCTIDLLEPSVSRRHCVFQYKDMISDAMGNCVSGFMIYDLKSTHGTFLNGNRIPSMENIKLQHGDKIMLGQCALVFMFIDLKQEGQGISSSQNGSSVAGESIQENNKETSPQPSSTTNVQTMVENERISEESLIMKYINLLNQLADLAKEHEEDGLSCGNKPILLKKFSMEHNRFVKQAQKIADILTQLAGEDPDIAEDFNASLDLDTTVQEGLDVTVQQDSSKNAKKSNRKRKIDDAPLNERPSKNSRLQKKNTEERIAEEIPTKKNKKSKGKTSTAKKQTDNNDEDLSLAMLMKIKPFKESQSKELKMNKAAREATVKSINSSDTVKGSSKRTRKADVELRSTISADSMLNCSQETTQLEEDPLAIPDEFQIEVVSHDDKKSTKSNKKNQKEQKQPGKRGRKPANESNKKHEKANTKRPRKTRLSRSLSNNEDNENRSKRDSPKKTRGKASALSKVSSPNKVTFPPKNKVGRPKTSAKREILSPIQPISKRSLKEKKSFKKSHSDLTLPANQPYILLRRVDLTNQNFY